MSNYPKVVEEFVEKIHKHFLEENFYEEHGISEFGPDRTREVFGKMVFSNWIKNGIADINEKEEEIDDAIKIIITGSIVDNMKKIKLLNTYEDDNGVEKIFLTKEGKEFAEKLKIFENAFEESKNKINMNDIPYSA